MTDALPQSKTTILFLNLARIPNTTSCNQEGPAAITPEKSNSIISPSFRMVMRRSASSFVIKYAGLSETAAKRRQIGNMEEMVGAVSAF